MSDYRSSRFLYVNAEQLAQGYCETQNDEMRWGKYVVMPCGLDLPEHIYYVMAPPLFRPDEQCTPPTPSAE